MKEDLVSIIMPSYNTGKFIKETINSVLNQTYNNWELIIVDDCSTDDTEEIVNAIKDNRIKFLKNSTNSGAAISRNKAIKEAKVEPGQWVAIYGAGGLGNLAIQYAKKVFNARVVAVDINQDKLDLAKESGADLVVNGKEVEDVAGYIQEKTGGTHSAVVTAVSKVAFNQAIDSVRAGGTVVAVGLPSEYMELSIVKTVLDGIRVVGSLVGTRKDLEEAFDFGAQGLVVPVVETVPVDTAVEVFDQMEKGQIQGRKVLDFTK